MSLQKSASIQPRKSILKFGGDSIHVFIRLFVPIGAKKQLSVHCLARARGAQLVEMPQPTIQDVQEELPLQVCDNEVAGLLHLNARRRMRWFRPSYDCCISLGKTRSQYVYICSVSRTIKRDLHFF